MNESTMQAVLMRYCMQHKSHDCVIPNSDSFFRWEADLISITKASLVHEFEIKLNMADYKRDALKTKHSRLGGNRNSPAYFWYATFEFDITPPEKAGWIRVDRNDHGGFKIRVVKDAPRLNTWKPEMFRIVQALRLVSWRLTNIYDRDFLKQDYMEVTLH